MDKFYKILGVSPSINKSELKKAYRKLVVVHHPDAGGNEERFKEISKAYEILTGKRKLSRLEKQEQQKEQAKKQYVQQESYNPPTSRPSRNPYEASPRRAPRIRYVDYEYTAYEQCRACEGVGTQIEFCHNCKGTKTFTGHDKNGNVQVGKCTDCPPTGYEVTWICDKCVGAGKIQAGTNKSTKPEYY